MGKVYQVKAPLYLDESLKTQYMDLRCVVGGGAHIGERWLVSFRSKAARLINCISNGYLTPSSVDIITHFSAAEPFSTARLVSMLRLLEYLFEILLIRHIISMCNYA